MKRRRVDESGGGAAAAAAGSGAAAAAGGVAEGDAVTRLFIGGLPNDYRFDDLVALLQVYGIPHKDTTVLRPASQKCSACACIKVTSSYVSAVVETFDGMQVRGYNDVIKVAVAGRQVESDDEEEEVDQGEEEEEGEPLQPEHREAQVDTPTEPPVAPVVQEMPQGNEDDEYAITSYLPAYPQPVSQPVQPIPQPVPQPVPQTVNPAPAYPYPEPYEYPTPLYPPVGYHPYVAVAPAPHPPPPYLASALAPHPPPPILEDTTPPRGPILDDSEALQPPAAPPPALCKPSDVTSAKPMADGKVMYFQVHNDPDKLLCVEVLSKVLSMYGTPLKIKIEAKGRAVFQQGWAVMSACEEVERCIENLSGNNIYNDKMTLTLERSRRTDVTIPCNNNREWDFTSGESGTVVLLAGMTDGRDPATGDVLFSISNIHTLLGVYGDVLRVKVIKVAGEKNDPQGQALVQFRHPEEVKNAIDKLHGCPVFGAKLRVVRSKNKNTLTASKTDDPNYREFLADNFHRFGRSFPAAIVLETTLPPSSTLSVTNLPDSFCVRGHSPSLMAMFAGFKPYAAGVREVAADKPLGKRKKWSGNPSFEGLVDFLTIESAVEALLALHDKPPAMREPPPFISFSDTSFDQPLLRVCRKGQGGKVKGGAGGGCPSQSHSNGQLKKSSAAAN